MDKYYGIVSSMLMGIVLVIVSIIMFILKGQFYLESVNFIIFIFFIKFILDLYEIAIKRNNKIIINSIFHIGTYFFFLFVPNFFYGLAPFLFSVYLCIIGISYFVMCYLSIRNGEFIKFGQFFRGSICFIMGIPIMVSPVMRLDSFVVIVSIYMLLLGLCYCYDGIGLMMSISIKNKLKRRIRITLPKVLESIIPYSVMMEINRNLEVRDVNTYSYDSLLGESNLSILIHTSNRGVNRMGHMDIYFDGKVISYGNYDEGSRFGREFFGDGVLFETKNKDDYIDFCIDNSKKTIFEFGIKLTNEQMLRIRQKLDKLYLNVVEWDYRSDKKYNGGSSYASKLYKKTKAIFYKFTKGKYHTYFVMGVNCCHFVDEIVGESGMDILSINGIITPGTYYDYLNKELKRGNSNVVSMSVYNAMNRSGERK